MTTDYDHVSALFSLLSHEPRLRLLDELCRGEACVCHLQAILDHPQAYGSQQLGVLREAGAVADPWDGLFAFYQIADPLVEQLLEQTLGPPRKATSVPGCPCPRCETESA